MEFHSKWNVTQNKISPKRDVIQNEMFIKKKCHSKLNVTQNGKSLKMESHAKRNVTQNL